MRMWRGPMMMSAATDAANCSESADPFDAVCTCQYDDWHEEISEVIPRREYTMPEARIRSSQ